MNYCTTYCHTLPQTVENVFFRLRALAFRLRAMYTAVAGSRHTSQQAERRFLCIINSYGDIISRICYSFADSNADYQDLRQDTLLNLWRGIDRFRGDSEISTWVYRVTMNTCVSQWRNSRTRRLRFIPLDPAAGEIADTDSAALTDDIERLHILLGSLPPLDRSLIILWLEERTYDEIARIAGLNRNTVASRLRRIRIRLAEAAASAHI